MKKLLLASVALMLAVPVVQAQTANPAPTIQPAPTPAEMKLPRPDRAKGISTALAIEAAVEANRVCLGNTYQTTSMIADSAGVPIVVISNDGAKAITQRIAQSKAMIALAAKGPSNGAKVDAALGVARPGGFPLMAGTTLVGAIAVSGSPSGQADEVCANAAIAKIQARIK